MTAAADAGQPGAAAAPGPGATAGDRAAEAVAHARDLLGLEDEHLSARLHDAERATDAAVLEDVLAWVGRSLSAPGRLRPLEYRKLAAVQAAVRARLADVAQSAPGSRPSPSGQSPTEATPAPARPGGAARPWWRRLLRM